ncbi:hypothetical protein ACSBR2_013125 [Camellia fascicularis]
MMISVRSLPELSLLKETSIRGLSLSTPKLNSVSENAVCCLWDGELIIVNGDQDMFVVSVLLQKKIYRNLDSVSQVYKKDLIVAQGVISAPVIHKEKKKINIVLTLFEVSPNLTCDGAASMEVLSSRASCYKEVGEYKKAVVDCTKLTGRVEEKRRWSEGIHKGVKIEIPNISLNPLPLFLSSSANPSLLHILDCPEPVRPAESDQRQRSASGGNGSNRRATAATEDTADSPPPDEHANSTAK